MFAWLQTLCRLTVSVVACVVSFAVEPAGATQHVRMLLDWAFQGPQSLFTYASQKGYFTQEGLDVSIDRGYGSADAIIKLATGTYDIAFGDINSMMEFNTKNPEKRQLISVMMVYDRAPLCVVSIDPSIKTPRDLEGRKLVTTHGAADLNLFPIFARNAGVDPQKISFIYVQPQLREPLLVRHEADASTAFYHTSYMSLKALNFDVSKMTVFMYSDFGVELYGNGIITSRDFANAKPDVIKGFNRALTRALKDIYASPEVAIPSLKERDETIREVVELERLKIVDQQSVFTPYVMKNGFGDIDRERMQRAIAQVTEVLALPKAPSVDAVFTDAYLPPRVDRQVHP